MENAKTSDAWTIGLYRKYLLKTLDSVKDIANVSFFELEDSGQRLEEGIAMFDSKGSKFEFYPCDKAKLIASLGTLYRYVDDPHSYDRDEVGQEAESQLGATLMHRLEEISNQHVEDAPQTNVITSAADNRCILYYICPSEKLATVLRSYFLGIEVKLF